MRAPPRRRNSAGTILLALSIGLNLFLIGWEVTQHLGTPAVSKFHPSPESVAEAIAAGLPSSDADILLRAFAERRAPLQAARQQYLVEFERVRQVISAEPFDRDAFEQSIAQLRHTRETERTLFGDAMRDVIPRLSSKGRQAFVATHMGGRP